MTNRDKALLRHIMRNEPKTPDWEAADECNCTVATARKYRKALAK